MPRRWKRAMATTPLTVVEGAMALPRSRPFNDVPAPFGCGWALLAPGYCLDSRLHGLYGAVLKTFNLNEQPIRSFCRWVAPENRRAAAAAAAGVAAVIGERVVDSGAAGRSAVLGAAGGGGSVGSVGSAGSVGSSDNAGSATAAAFADSVSADAPPSAETLPRAEAPGSSGTFAPVATHTSEAERHAPRAPLMPRRMLAGAACALTGVALVAWLAPRHDDASRQGDGKDMRSVQHGAVRNMTTAQAPSLAGAGAAKYSGEATHATVMTATPTAQSKHAAAAPAPAPVLTPAPATVGATATGAEPAPARARTMVVEEATSNKETTTQIPTHAPQTAPTVRIPKQAVARNGDHRRSAHRAAASTTALSRPHEAAGHAANLAANLTAASPASRRFVKPSVAGSYSPLAPSPLGIDDYASVDLSANTRSNGRSQRAQPPSFAPSSPDSGQQWMSRLSQRRVTEVPDQFIR